MKIGLMLIIQTEMLLDCNSGAIAETPVATSAFESDPLIGFKACSFSWEASSMGVSQGKKKKGTRERFELRFDDETSFRRGAINLILGPTASGKARDICL